MYDNSDFFNDDLNFILALSKEEYRYNDLLFDKMQKVMDNVRNMKGINKTIALEATRVYDDLNIRVNKFTDEVSTVNYSAAMEEMSKGMMALIAAGIAAFIAMIWKIIGFLTDEPSGSTSGYGGGGGGGNIKNKINVAESNSAIVEAVVKGAPKILEQKTKVIDTVSHVVSANPDFANELNGSDKTLSVEDTIKDLKERLSGKELNLNSHTVDKIRYFLAFIRLDPGVLLNENSELNELLSDIPKVIREVKELLSKSITDGSADSFLEKLKESINIEYFTIDDNGTKSESIVFDNAKLFLDKLKNDIEGYGKHIGGTELGELSDAELSSDEKAIKLLKLLEQDGVFEHYKGTSILILKTSERFSNIHSELVNLYKELTEIANANNDNRQVPMISRVIKTFINSVRRYVFDTTNILDDLKRSLNTIEYVITEILSSLKSSKEVIASFSRSIERIQTISEENRNSILKEIKIFSDEVDKGFSVFTDLSNKVSTSELADGGNKAYRLHNAIKSYSVVKKK